MQRIVLFLLFFGLLLCSTVAASQPSETLFAKHFKENQYTYDAYGNVHLKFDKFSENTIKVLSQIRKKMQTQFPKIGMFVHIPVVFGGYAPQIKAAEFELYDIDCEKQTISFLFKNGRGIPNIHNSCAGNAVFIFRENSETGKKELLVVNDIDKPFCNVVGGCVDNLERVADGAAREVKEEIGLIIKPSDLRLLKVTNRVDENLKTNRFGFFYSCEVFEGEPKPDGQEVVDFKWVPLDEVLSDDFKCFGKKFGQSYIKLLKAVYGQGQLQQEGNSHEYQIATVEIN